VRRLGDLDVTVRVALSAEVCSNLEGGGYLRADSPPPFPRPPGRATQELESPPKKKIAVSDRYEELHCKFAKTPPLEKSLWLWGAFPNSLGTFFGSGDSLSRESLHAEARRRGREAD